LTSNVAVAVNPALPYLKVRQGDEVLYLAQGARGALQGPFEVLEEIPGSELLGWSYAGPFDDLPAEAGIEHTVIPWDDVSADEGTGLVHIAPGCGAEDFALGKEFGLPSVAPIDQNGIYLDGFGWLTGRNVQDVGEDIIADLKSRGILYRVETIEHRYPTCWRCHTPLVFRLVDEWFISMDPLREPMMEVARQVRWIPPYGLERELDWLRNMRDWMISKKRYWGLALPFWICPNNHLTVIGGKEELFERGLTGLDGLESPHRPWIDEVTIRCDTCGEIAHRIPDVGNPWLDAGIVPYSTINYDTDPSYWREWFPADFITESFPGQFRNWFYSMLAMSTVLEDTAPFKTVLGYALMRDETGREMHKSWGNLIPFDEAAERAGADTMRWLFAEHDPEKNLNFGWGPLDEVKRRLLVLWNTYSFFVTYASVDGWTPGVAAPQPRERSLLDRWILARLNGLIVEVRTGLDDYNPMDPALAIDRFIEDLSTWYVRRSRRRFWKSETDADKLAAYATLYECLTTLTRLMAPFVPFLSETLYQNLVRGVQSDVPVSVHLTDYPVPDESLIDRDLLAAMDAAQRVVALGRAARDTSGYRVRQPLARISVVTPDAVSRAHVDSLRDVILDELNVKSLEYAGGSDQYMEYTIKPNLSVLGPKYGKRLGAIRRELEALDAAAVAAAVGRGEPVPVQLDGETIQLQPDEVLTSAREREGFAAAAGDGFLVALDTHLTPQLIHEGWAREVVRRVNDWRKAAGFNVDDRIRIAYTASPELERAIAEYHDYIRDETLAVELRPGELDSSEFQSEAAFGDQKLAVQMHRASRERIGI
jgi:isoleucyl-tRNA synthetase